MNRYQSFLGYTAKDMLTDKVLGCITSIEQDGNNFWYTIDEEYQVSCAGSEEVIVLSTGETFIRVK